MASESVTNDPALKAFTGNDSSVFLAQAMAVADLIGTGNHSQCDERTVNEAGMVVFMLLDAARAHIKAEREFMWEQHRVAMLEAKAWTPEERRAAGSRGGDAMNEEMVCRLVALLDEKLGTVEEGEPRRPRYEPKVRTAEEELACEHRRCQLHALLDKEWGKRPGPKLTLVQGGLKP